MIARRVLVALVLLIPAIPAHAQTAAPPAPARLQIGIDAGSQAKASAFTDAFDVPLYTQQEHVSTDYPSAGGLFTSVSARCRVWKQLTVGIGVSQFAHSGDVTVKAALPHPFFDDQPRNVEGTARARRQEVAVHPTVGWLIPISSRVQLAIAAGPSILQVKQALVTGVKFSETYPYDTALFTNAEVRDSSRSAVGVYAGADVSWMFSKHLGAGGIVQITRATVKEKTGDRTVSIDAGGVQGGGGLRIAF